MRIAMVTEHASPLADVGSVDAGGQNVYVREIASRLAASGHAVDVFTRRDAAGLDTVVDVSPGFRVVHVPAGPAERVPKEALLQHMDQFTEWMAEWMEGERYDIAHANFFMSGLVTRRLLDRFGMPYVVTFHALGAVRRLHQKEADRFPVDRVDLEKEVIAHATAIIAECPQDEADLIRWYEVPSSKLVTIPCGVDTEMFRPVGKSLARARRGWGEDEWVILHVGRMVPRKGVTTVIEALAELRARGDDDARLVVVGGSSEDPARDPEVRSLMSLAEDLGVREAVTFEGRVDHGRLHQFYGAADVFVTTPWYEPFGITPLEAMASGLPVVGSNVGGIKFTVRDGETGFLVPPRDPVAVADRIQELRQHTALAAAFSANARRRVRDLFTWTHVADSIAELYEEAAGQGSPQSSRDDASLASRSISELGAVLTRSRDLDGALLRAGSLMIERLRQGGRVLVCGNGGSASQAQHLAAELMGRFEMEGRPALGVVALTADTAFLTAWSNDVGFHDVFARQVEGLGRPGDVLIGLSTSGNSANVLEAVQMARRIDVATIALTGGDGGALATAADVSVVVPSRNTQRIQEVHLLMIHTLSAIVEAGVVARSVPRETLQRQPALLSRELG